MNDLRNWALKNIDEANSILAAVLITIFVLLVIFLIITGVVWITMWIWNAVMPVIFGLPEITTIHFLLVMCFLKLFKNPLSLSIILAYSLPF